MPIHTHDTESSRSRTVMAGYDHAAGRSREHGQSLLERISERLFGRRRTYLVDRAYQIRSAVVAVLGMAFLAAFSVALFRLMSAESARELAGKAPLLTHGVPASDTRSVLYLVAVGVIFVGAVFVVEILETHKTAGVVYKVTRGLTELQGGRWGAKVALRRHDNFKEMEEAFNAATRALREEVEGDLHSLRAVEGQLRLAAREMENGNHAGALLLSRQIEAELQTFRERKRNLLNGAPGERIATKI
jgi:hypothetical protein